MAPAPLKTPRGDRLAFITYYKGEYKLHTKDTAEPVKEVEQEVQAAAEGLVDFQPDVTHEVVPENKRRKKLFEGLYLEGRPPHQRGRHLERQLLRRHRGRPHRRARRPALHVHRAVRRPRTASTTAATRTSPRACTTGSTSSTRPTSSTRTTRVLAVLRLRHPRPRDRHPALHRAGRPSSSTRSTRSAAWRSGWASIKVEEQFGDAERPAADLPAERDPRPALLHQQRLADPDLAAPRPGDDALRGVRPALGEHLRLGVTCAPGRRRASSSARRSTPTCASTCASAATSALLALRGRGFYSTGDNPDYFYFGGNMELRGYPYYGFAGNQGFFANAELRLPLINLAATPIGILGPAARHDLLRHRRGASSRARTTGSSRRASPATPTSTTPSSASR